MVEERLGMRVEAGLVVVDGVFLGMVMDCGCNDGG